MNLSLVSRIRELSIVDFPSFPTERRERGTVLWQRRFISARQSSVSRNAPDGLVVLFFGRSRLKESVLANVDPALDFSDLDDWVSHLGPKFEYIPPRCVDRHTPS